MRSIRAITTKVLITMHAFVSALTTLSERAGILHPNRLSDLISDVTFNILHVDKLRAVWSSKYFSSNRLSNFLCDFLLVWSSRWQLFTLFSFHAEWNPCNFKTAVMSPLTNTSLKNAHLLLVHLTDSSCAPSKHTLSVSSPCSRVTLGASGTAKSLKESLACLSDYRFACFWVLF